MISESQMKLLKRNRRSYIQNTEESNQEDINQDYSSYHYYNSRISPDFIFKLKSLPDGPHAPNRNESRELRKICSQTGLTPAQVRTKEIYRQRLAKASKTERIKGHRVKTNRICQTFRIHLMGKLGNLHPLSVEFRKAFIKEWHEEQKKNIFCRYSCHGMDGQMAYILSFKHPENIIF